MSRVEFRFGRGITGCEFALLFIGLFSFEARSLPSRAYRHYIKSVRILLFTGGYPPFASSELHGYYEHAEKQLITLAALAGDGGILGCRE